MTIIFGPMIDIFQSITGARPMPNGYSVSAHAMRPNELTRAFDLKNEGSANRPGLSETDEEVCQKMGLDPVKFAAMKKGAEPEELGLTEEDWAVCRKMGLDPVQFAKVKQGRPAHGSGPPLIPQNM